ncbi:MULTISPECIES: hypothetical protein [unclassified Streptomyces]|uniref:hypothetical protein n=1 Tax=unclassified Streptomyces TaxID=2593676 RepID=UPI000B8A52E6|nr:MULTISPECIES: hypothetical protein [unclassified Streptomyces]MYS19177.1 hypothetical protein [Streptomyces sp. SID4948]
MARRSGIPYTMALQHIMDRDDAAADASDHTALSNAFERLLDSYLDDAGDDVDTAELAGQLATRAIEVMTDVPEEVPTRQGERSEGAGTWGPLAFIPDPGAMEQLRDETRKANGS